MHTRNYWSNLSPAERIAAGLTLFAVLLLVAQHWHMTLSNADDPWFVRADWQMCLQTSSMQGRFWMIPICTLTGLPYKLGGWFLASLTKIVVNAAVFLLFVRFCSHLVNRSVGLLIGLLWLALIDVSPGHYSPFHGYSLMFNLPFAVLFGSFLSFLKIIDTDINSKNIVAPYLLFAFAMLAYEPMLFYAGVFPSLYLYRSISQNCAPRSVAQWRAFCVAFVKANWMLPAVVICYIVVYFMYRAFQPTFGRGVDGIGNIYDFLLTVYRFSVNGFHVQVKPLVNYLPDSTVWKTAAAAIAYGLCVGVGCTLLLPKIVDDANLVLLNNRWSIGIVAFFVCSPNLLLAMVESYRRWAADDPHYVGNYLSSFPLAILVTLAALGLVGGKKAMREKALFFLVAWLLASSACDNYLRWATLADKNRESSHLWRMALADISTKNKSNDRAATYCGLHAPDDVSGDDDYWSWEISKTLEKPVRYFSKNLSAVRCDVEVDFHRYR